MSDAPIRNLDGGYTLQCRRLWHYPAFRNRQEAAVFAWMIAEAQWRDHHLRTKFGIVSLRRGELLIAERELADEFGLHRNTVRTLLQRMVDQGIITRFQDRSPHRTGTVVLINNYELYQGFGDQSLDGQDRNEDASRTAAGPRTNKKNKKTNLIQRLKFSNCSTHPTPCK